MKDDLSKYFAIVQLETTLFIVDLDGSNGNLNDVREISFPSLTFTSLETHAGGAISDSMLICSTQTDSSKYHIISLINTDTWTLTSYNAPSGNMTFFGFSKLFDTDQIILILSLGSNQPFSLKTAYNKLNYTELYTS